MSKKNKEDQKKNKEDKKKTEDQSGFKEAKVVIIGETFTSLFSGFLTEYFFPFGLSEFFSICNIYIVILAFLKYPVLIPKRYIIYFHLFFLILFSFY